MKRGFTNIQLKAHSVFSSFQFFSTLFAPLGFFADKMESFMPSSFWHQLTRIWPHLNTHTHTHIHTHTHTRHTHTHTHTHQYHSKPSDKKCLLSCLQHYCPLAALLLIMLAEVLSTLQYHSWDALPHCSSSQSFSKTTFSEYHLQRFHRVIHLSLCEHWAIWSL